MASFAIDKDPTGILDYTFDWAPLTNESGTTDWLVSGDTISSYVITAESGITVDNDTLSNESTSVTVWLSGGTAGAIYTVACKITTIGGRTDKREADIRVIER